MNRYKALTPPLPVLIGMLTIILMLSACNNRYTVATNIDKNNFTDYFSAASVKIYQSEQEFIGAFKFLGLVEGQDCQNKAHHIAPEETKARTQARRQAYEQQANAIIFTGCALISDSQVDRQCLSSLVCYGKAYQVQDKSK